MTDAVMLAIHVVGASFMCGLGWVVQVVHYPLFDRVESSKWAEFHSTHSDAIGRVVALPWAMQGIGALGLLAWRPSAVPVVLVLLAVALAGTTVLATLALAIPAHTRLANGFDHGVHSRLVVTNWVRTIAWTAAAIVAGLMVVASVG